MNPADARARIDSFRGKRVVVVGDVMLDEFVRGDVTRVSPEAPVPVVDLRHRSSSPGGAGNAASNVVSLGGRATIVGLIGDDAIGTVLLGALRASGIDTNGVLSSSARVTTHKLRIIAHTQQIVRVDAETRERVTEETEDRLIALAQAALAHADGLLLSDYSKGVVSDRVARATIVAARQRSLPVVIDPKGREYAKYAGATIVTPNVLELETATGTSTENEDAAIVDAGQRLIASLDGTSVLVTRGARGMTLLEPNKSALHLPTLARSVLDVTGAGDTVVGTLVLALAAGVSLPEALELASHAARIAVSTVGTAAVTREELLQSFH